MNIRFVFKLAFIQWFIFVVDCILLQFTDDIFNSNLHGKTDDCIIKWGSYPPATTAKQPPFGWQGDDASRREIYVSKFDRGEYTSI